MSLYLIKHHILIRMRFIDVKSRHVMYYLPFDRLMGLWIINEFLKSIIMNARRCGGLVVMVLVLQLKDLCLSSGWVTVSCCQVPHWLLCPSLYIALKMSTQILLGNPDGMTRVPLWWTYIFPGGSNSTCSHFMLLK